MVAVQPRFLEMRGIFGCSISQLRGTNGSRWNSICFFQSYLSVSEPYVVSICADAVRGIHSCHQCVIVVWLGSIPAFRIVGCSELVRLFMDMCGSVALSHMFITGPSRSDAVLPQGVECSQLVASFSVESHTPLLITSSSPYRTQLCEEYKVNLFFFRRGGVFSRIYHCVFQRLLIVWNGFRVQ
jgi:hypothetical protein